jgi:hypothetical protein
MRPTRRAAALAAGALLATLGAPAARADGSGPDATVLPDNLPLHNPDGFSSSFSRQGRVEQTGSFFQKLGTNDRTCNTCHLAGDGWTLSARSAKRLFNESGGLAALFPFDGQTCRGQDLSTVQARRVASSLMLAKAVVRFDKTFPAGGEIEIAASEGTYCNPIDASNHGNGAEFRVFDIGTSDPAQRTPDLPLYTLRNKLTGETRQTSDAGAALATGLWADIGKFKIPNLRGLAARAPYFHNGTAEDLEAVVDFYDARFDIGLALAERDDLVAFLRAL